MTALVEAAMCLTVTSRTRPPVLSFGARGALSLALTFACDVQDFAIIERMNLITTGPFPFDADGGYDLAKFCPALEVAERARCDAAAALVENVDRLLTSLRRGRRTKVLFGVRVVCGARRKGRQVIV